MKWETDPTKVWPSGNLVPMHGRKVRVHEKQKILFGGTTVPISLQNYHLNTAKLPLHAAAAAAWHSGTVPLGRFPCTRLIRLPWLLPNNGTSGSGRKELLTYILCFGSKVPARIYITRRSRIVRINTSVKDWVDQKQNELLNIL